MSDITDTPIVPQPKKARAATRRKKKKRRGTPRPNLVAINARRQQEAAARRRLVTASSNRESPADPTIEEFVTGRQYLGLRPTPYQVTLQKAMYGLALTDPELDIWRESTGGREYPGKPFSELTCIAGARSGKNSYIETPILLYEALYGGFTPNRGETCAVVLVAQDARAATISLELARGYLKQSPLLSKFLVKATKDTLFLSNGIRFMVFPCTSRSIYGFSIVGAAMDELGRFRFEGAADTDADVQHAILRGMAKLYNKPAKLIKISSPSSRAGLLYSDFQRSFGKPDPHRLVWLSIVKVEGTTPDLRIQQVLQQGLGQTPVSTAEPGNLRGRGQRDPKAAPSQDYLRRPRDERLGARSLPAPRAREMRPGSAHSGLTVFCVATFLFQQSLQERLLLWIRGSISRARARRWPLVSWIRPSFSASVKRTLSGRRAFRRRYKGPVDGTAVRRPSTPPPCRRSCPTADLASWIERQLIVVRASRPESPPGGGPPERRGCGA